MIVDCHVNIWNEEDVSAEYERQQSRIRERAIPKKADAATLAKQMAMVDRAIIFTLSYGNTIGVAGADSTTAAAVNAYPEKFIGFAYVDPRSAGYMEALRFAIEDLGLRGVKYGPIYNGVALDDPRMTPIYEYCVEKDLPLTMHMGTTYTRQYHVDLGRPLHVESVALRYPDLKLIMAHMGHPWYEECTVIVRKQPNVYAEISAIYYRQWQFYNVMMNIQEYQVADKIFFGSDYPFSTPKEGVELMRAVTKIGRRTSFPRVSSEVVEQIIHSNPLEHWWHDGPSIGRHDAGEARG